MSDGLFSPGGSEQFRQAKITRERFLVVNTSPTGDLEAGAGHQTAASSFASLDPGDVTFGAQGNFGMGPHFVMSGDTSDDSHTYGFKFCLLEAGFQGNAVVAAEGGLTVTIWGLVGSLQIQQALPEMRQTWADFEPQTGVGFRQWWHSFDCNAMALRFQFTNIASHGNIGIAFAEL